MNILQNLRDVFRPVLSDRAIIKYYKRGMLIDNTIDLNQVQPNSVDLTVSNDYKVIKPNAFLSEIPDPLSQLSTNKVRILNAIDPAAAIDYGMKVFNDYVKIGRAHV